MNPQDYYHGFIWIHKSADCIDKYYEDTRTGQEFDTEEEMKKHCQEQAENFESEVETEWD